MLLSYLTSDSNLFVHLINLQKTEDHQPCQISFLCICTLHVLKINFCSILTAYSWKGDFSYQVSHCARNNGENVVEWFVGIFFRLILGFYVVNLFTRACFVMSSWEWLKSL
jgi:hypothetical protein